MQASRRVRAPSPSVLLALLLTLILGCGCAARSAPPRVPGSAPPRLAVLLVVDQLRPDMLERLYARFGSGGFRRLYEQGVSYEAAAYAHGATETAVGHATIATGALPRVHGIVGNDWSEDGRRVYAVDDFTQPVLRGTTPGKSPAKLLTETIGDVLVARHPRALVRSVSQKERSAILLAGRAGVAYWLDESAGGFVTSRFYAERLPGWVSEFTEEHPIERYRRQRWELLQPASRYLASDVHAWEERGCGLLGCRFPHGFGGASGPFLVHAFKTTPLADVLTVEFVGALLANEPLGRDDVPDLLAVSLASTDYVGHAFGPESREAEDNLLRVDRAIAELFELLDERVGADRYFVILTSDHGGSESPEHFRARGLDAGRINPVDLRAAVDAGLRERLGLGVELVRDFVNPTLVLHEQRIASLSLPLAEVERAAAEIAAAQPGVHAAYARSDLLGEEPAGERDPLEARLRASIHPERSGHVYIVPKERWLLATKPERLTAMHGTPWPYDTAVPLVVWGTGARAQRVGRPVDPRDIAPTVARLLGLRPPRSASGAPLQEVL